MEQFHSALRSLAEFCQLGALEDGLLTDIFTANMIDHEIQKYLLKVTLDPEKALELAISIELGARSQLAIQAKHIRPINGINSRRIGARTSSLKLKVPWKFQSQLQPAQRHIHTAQRQQQ